MKQLIFLNLVVALAFTAIGCGGSSGSGDETLDANGAYDMTEQDVLTLLTNVAQECSGQNNLAGIGSNTKEACESACDCSTTAVAKLENRTEAPELKDACYNACDPNFTPTDDVEVSEADSDDEPEFDNFYLAYLLKCDEIGHAVISTDADFVTECVATCNCIADTMEKYISTTADDNLRAGCQPQCELSVPKAAVQTKMLSFVSGGGAL